IYNSELDKKDDSESEKSENDEDNSDSDSQNENKRTKPKKKENKFILKTIKFNAALLKIIVEILSNAIDNKWTSENANPPIPMKKIEISIDRDSGSIKIWNDGYYIPIIKTKYEYCDGISKDITIDELYPAELYFGYMLAGTNFENDDSRETIGKNGIGC